MSDTSLSVITLTYVKPLARVDELLPRHNAWLDEQYAAGRFLASGRQRPRVGGVILARLGREEAERVVQGDPFGQAGVATYDIVEFVPNRGPLRDLLDGTPPAGA